MSPTLLARLRRAERMVQRWRAEDYFALLERGWSPQRAHYYSARRCWPDAVTAQRQANWQY